MTQILNRRDAEIFVGTRHVVSTLSTMTALCRGKIHLAPAVYNPTDTHVGAQGLAPLLNDRIMTKLYCLNHRDCIA